MRGENVDPVALAFKFLRVAERTEAELRAYLVRKGVTEDEVERVVEMTIKKRFVSDERIVEREVELAKGERKIGREKTEARLLARGVDESLVTQAVREYSEVEEAQNAATLLKYRLKPGDTPAKMARFLVSRGFSEDAVRSAIEQAFPEFSD